MPMFWSAYASIPSIIYFTDRLSVNLAIKIKFLRIMFTLRLSCLPLSSVLKDHLMQSTKSFLRTICSHSIVYASVNDYLL